MAAFAQKSFAQLGECFGRYMPAAHLRPAASGAHSRRRFYSRENTFWAFFSQVLAPDGGCRETVARLQSYAALKSMDMPSASTAAYCNARKKLDEKGLQAIFEHTATAMAGSAGTDLVGGRRVVVVDGTGAGMPDTEANQGECPQQSQQQPGCGFPVAHICGCFALGGGTLPGLEAGNKKSSERRRILGMLHESIARNLVPERPGRSEPRCVKRRPKPYQYMTAPRHEMQETKHRGRKHARTA